MMRRAAAKPTLNLGGISIDQSDDEMSSAQKNHRSGENPFDSSCQMTPNDHEADPKKVGVPQSEHMKNLFFH